MLDNFVPDYLIERPVNPQRCGLPDRTFGAPYSAATAGIAESVTSIPDRAGMPVYFCPDAITPGIAWRCEFRTWAGHGSSVNNISSSGIRLWGRIWLPQSWLIGAGYLGLYWLLDWASYVEPLPHTTMRCHSVRFCRSPARSL